MSYSSDVYVDAVRFTVGGALFFVFPVMVSVAAHAKLQAPFSLFIQDNPQT